MKALPMRLYVCVLVISVFLAIPYSAFAQEVPFQNKSSEAQSFALRIKREMGPSFDCREAALPVDKLICSLQGGLVGLGGFDETMAEIFVVVKTNSKDPAQVVASQREWLRSRTVGCDVVNFPFVPFWPSRQAALCVREKYEERIEELRLEAGTADPFDVDGTDRPGAVFWKSDDQFTLITAASKGDLLTLNRFIKSKKVDLTPALYSAAAGGSLASVKLLIAAGVSPNTLTSYLTRSRNATTPIYPASLEDNRAIVDYLLAHSANIFVPVKGDLPLIILSVMTGHDDLVRQVLATHPNLEVYDFLNKTPLREAVERGYVEIVNLLLDAGANPNENPALSYDKTTILSDAINQGAGLAIISLLVQHGADPNISNPEDGATPIVSTSDIKVAGVLLKAGAHINDVDDTGRTALHYAAMSCNTPLMKFLLDHGADPSIQNRWGQTPYQGWQAEEHKASCPASAWPKEMIVD